MKPAPHPAKFSDGILEVLRDFLPPDVPTLDPMAGHGRIFEVAPWAVGLEIEPDWACADPRIIMGNCLQPPFRPGTFRRQVTSCTYGNRMADNYNAQERCKPCAGSGRVFVATDPVDTGVPVDGIWTTCAKCGGLGFRTYKRLTYRHQIGHPLHPDNSGGMPWGPRYQAFHQEAWRVLLDLMDDDPDARFVLNSKDHWRTLKKGEPPVRQMVTAWHVETFAALGWVIDRMEWVETPSMKFGQNRDLREPGEWVISFRRKNPPNPG